MHTQQGGKNTMSDKILVTYATRLGATGEVAAFIGQTLTDAGLNVEVLPVEDVADPAPYRGVVIGSAIQGQKWLPEAMQFVRTHEAELSRKPVAIFQVCMTAAMKNEKWRVAAKEWLGPARARISPFSEAVFPGVLDLSKIPSLRKRLMFWFSVLFGVWEQGDHRDWEAIGAWAEALTARLR